MKEFTKKDTACDMYTVQPNAPESNIGKVAILPYNFFKTECRKPENQLFRLEGGFGTSPLGRGNSCYGRFCVDGEECRIDKFEFVGIGNAEVQQVGARLEAEWQSSSANEKQASEME